MTQQPDKLKVVFWNINKKYFGNMPEVFDYFYSEGVDIVYLAEADDEAAASNLVAPNFQQFTVNSVLNNWIKVYKRKNFRNDVTVELKEHRCDGRAVFTRIQKGIEEFYLTSVHFKSKGGVNLETQTARNQVYVNEIVSFENAISDNNIILGDFNHNPHESIINGTHLFNAIASRKVIESVKDMPFDGNGMKMRYNPMWNFLGDNKSAESAVPGTFYYPSNKHDTNDYHCNVLDQVIVNQSMMKRVDVNDVMIYYSYDNNGTTISFNRDSIESKNGSFVKPGYSDHLPIGFTVDLN